MARPMIPVEERRAFFIRVRITIEAAIQLVCYGVNNTESLIRLSIAHLYNMRVGGSERSEGYVELIAFIAKKKIKDHLRLAMRIEVNGRKIFQKKFQSDPFWSDVQESLSFLNFPIEERISMLNQYIGKLDLKYGPKPSKF